MSKSNYYTRRKLIVVRDYCISWTIAFIVFALVRGLGTEEQGSLRLDFASSVKIVLTLGPIMGVFSGLTQVWMEDRIYRRVSILKFLALRLVNTLLFLVLLMVSAFLVYKTYFNLQQSFAAFAFQAGGFAVYFYLILIDLLINTMRQLNLMFGGRNLAKILTGKFYIPREEERVFMFLDLQSSTQLAEKLGHQLYSSLIQDCFNDLAVVIECQAEIYQYVGDEAVLTWNRSAGLEHDNAINAYFRYKDQLESRESYYMKTYGVIPFFKAGMHLGIVMVTEIGKYKREIAYHGDTINTAARIQGQCNALKAELLISEDLKQHIQGPYQAKNVGSILLRGKESEVDIYALSR